MKCCIFACNNIKLCNSMKRKTKETYEEFIEFLREKKKKDGRLSAFGEWILNGGSTGWILEDKNIRYVMR